MAHATMEKFGYPATLLREYKHWVIQLRPKQATLGALVLICKEDAEAFSEISAEAAAEMPAAIKDIERALSGLFSYDKINYLMLMMVDPHVHYHVLPRYSGDKEFAGTIFTDPGWPAVPDLGHATETDEAVRQKLINDLREALEA